MAGQTCKIGQVFQEEEYAPALDGDDACLGEQDNDKAPPTQSKETPKDCLLRGFQMLQVRRRVSSAHFIAVSEMWIHDRFVGFDACFCGEMAGPLLNDTSHDPRGTQRSICFTLVVVVERVGARGRDLEA